MLTRALLCAAVATLMLPAAATAQWVDADGNPVFNPGDTNPLTPRLFFSRFNQLSLDTSGLNNIADTDTGNRIGGDDVGFISLVIPGPEPSDILLSGLQGTGGVGTNWTSAYANGRLHLSGTPITEQYLMPIGTWPVVQYQPNWIPADFSGLVELRVNFSVGQPGVTLFGCIDFNLALSCKSCDFDGDGNCTINDLNLLLQQGPIAPGVPVTPGVNDQFDIDGNWLIDNGDVSYWLFKYGQWNGTSEYQYGDANLDGSVDVTDFNLWNGNKFTETLNWDDGNFNGDGFVDVGDFNRWNSNKFTSSDTSAVPEPSACMLMLVTFGVPLSTRFRT